MFFRIALAVEERCGQGPSRHARPVSGIFFRGKAVLTSHFHWPTSKKRADATRNTRSGENTGHWSVVMQQIVKRSKREKRAAPLLTRIKDVYLQWRAKPARFRPGWRNRLATPCVSMNKPVWIALPVSSSVAGILFLLRCDAVLFLGTRCCTRGHCDKQ